MGNSSRKNSKASSAEKSSKIVSLNSSRRSTRSNEVDERETNEFFDSDDEYGYDEPVRHWPKKIISTSSGKPRRRDRRQYSEPEKPIVGRPHAFADEDEDEMAARQRSKSTGFFSRMRILNRSSGNIPKQTATPSARPRRASESPAVGHKEQNGTSRSGVGGGQLQLSMVQINLVRKLWQHVRVQGENGPGISILRQHLFFRCPAVRHMFATDLDGKQSEMCYHKRLISHAEALSELLDELVNNLERAHIVNEKLRYWGRLHAHIRHIGFTAAFWDRFAESLNDCTLTWCQKAQRCFDAQVAWTTIVLYITEQLKTGYYEECRRQRKNAYPGGKSRSQGGTRENSVEYGNDKANLIFEHLRKVDFVDLDEFEDDMDNL